MRTRLHPRSIQPEQLERRMLMSAATDATGFYVPVATEGETVFQLVPIESVQPGVATRVSFGVPFPRGFVPAGDLSEVRLLGAGGAEHAAYVQLLTPWRDLAAGTDEGSARSVLLQADVSFPDADGDGDADPLGFSVEWGRSARALAAPAASPARQGWVLYDNAAAPAGTDFKAADGVYEPPAYALFSPDWYGQALLKARLLPEGSDPAFAGYDAAYQNFAATAVNDVDPRVTAANLIHYADGADEEPWLFDRAMTLYQLAFRSGDVKYLREAHRNAQYYANHVDADGYFEIKGPDLKYVYGEAISADYWLTGDDRLPAVHQRMVRVFDRDFEAAYSPGDMWTERHAAYKLLGYVTGFELLGGAELAQKARDTFAVYVDHQNNPPAGAANNGLLMHRSVDHIEGGSEFVASPWMTALLVDAVQRYYVHSGDARVPAFVTRVADGINRVGESMYYTAEVDGTTRLVPFYLAGPGLNEDQHQTNPWGDIEHAVDVSKVFALAYFFSRQAGSPSAAYAGRFAELQDSAQAAFQYWTRPNGPASGLSAYRLNPPRKFNWWFRTTADRDFLMGLGSPTTPDTEDPTAELTAPDLTAGGGATYQFTVTYQDNRGIDVSTLDSADIQVRGPNGFSQIATLVSVSSNTDGTPRSAVYRLSAPGGSWDPADDGSYQVDIRPGQIADTAGRFVAGEFLGRFNVATAGAPMITNVNAGNMTTTGATVTWTTNEGGTTQVEYGPTATYGFTTTLNSSMVTSHSAALTGLTPNTTYHFRVLSRNAAGVEGASTNFTFTTAATGGGDANAPTATGDVGPVTTGGDYTFTVTYSDNGPLNASSIDGNDVVVTGPNGFSQAASLVSVVNAGGTSRRATYRITAPGGAWDAADSGQYVVSLQAGQVLDTAGNAAPAAQLGTFDFAVANGRTLLGSFGLVNGRTSPLKFTDPDGTAVVASLKGGGTAQAFLEDGRVVIEVTGTGPKSSLALKGKGGDQRITLGDIRVAGALKGLKAATADLVGTMYVDGPLGTVTLGTVSGGTVAAAGNILGLALKGGIANGRVLAGVNLGADGEVGGGDDAAAAAVIRRITLGAAAVGSVFAAGALPGTNGAYGDADDVGTGAASAIMTFSSRGDADAATRFEAGTFGRFKIGRTRVDPAADPRFLLLA